MKVNAKEIKRRDYEVSLTHTELKNIVAEYIQSHPLVLIAGAIKDKSTVQAPMQPALQINFTTDAYHNFRATVRWHEAID